RFVMREGLIPVEEEAVPDWGDGLGGREVNMGNPMVLQEFMEWGMSHFPAKRHALILWNHVAGWRGDSKTETRQICQDTTSNDWLYTQELGETLKNAPPGTGLVGMDACLGGTVEAAYEIKAPDMVIVASEADVPASGWPYHLVLGDLATTPTLSAPELGHAIVERYRQTHGGKYPLSSVDLSLMNDLAAASAEFTSATLACSSEWPRIGEARRHTPALDTAGELVDIITLLGNIEELSRDDSIRIRAREMASAMERACLSYYHPPLTPARGLSVYFPDPRRYKKPDENYTCGQLSWACDTGWDKLIAAFLAADTNPPTLLHSPLGDTLETGPYTITATASDISGIGEVRLLWRKNGGPLRETVMKSIGEGSYSSQIPGPAMTGDVFCYRIMASDIPGNRSFFPGPSEDVLHIFSIGPSLEGLWEDFDGVNRIFDLSGKRLVFRPSLDLPTQYDLCLEDITGWSTDPTTGTALILGDDDFAALELEPGSVWFFGCSFDRIYVGSNGYITFGQGGTTYQAAALNHFNLPRISPAMGDLNPENGSGNIIYQILPDRVAVSWNGVAQVQGPGTNRFQAEMFRDGTIRFTWLEIHLNDVLVGISRGQGLPAGSETDFSTFDKCPEENPPRADVETPEDPGGFVRAAFTLTQESGCSAHVRIEYSADGGKNFEEATAAPGNETGGILFSSPGGRRYIFLWNTLIDTGPGRHEHVRLRVRPWTDLEGPGIAGEAGPFEIINPGWGEVVDCILARSAPPGEDARVLDVNKDGVVSVSDVLVLMYNEMYKTAP
ncbi:MAG TPA: clostripain-related cysteine peptidase, partial [Candidatus Sumerlaeota bacterium]|nr:clostripain-related cysteine peptidase [Candidatus Sumerlaeota bacterium]